MSLGRSSSTAVFLFCTLARASDNGTFESIRSQDTGRQAFERGGQTPSTHLGRCRTVSLRPREVEPADPLVSRCGRASSRKIKKPVEGRFSPLPRSTIPLLVGPRSQ